MFASLIPGVGRLLAVLTISLFASPVFAQWGGYGGICDPCGQTVAITPQYAAAPVAYTPYAQTAGCVCPCMQPVTETVYREVPVTEYKAVKKTVKKPVLRTVYEDKKVTSYRQVMEPRVAEVPTVSYQTVQECRPMTINQSYWQTIHQPVAKMSPCLYDSRPGLAGWFNRTSYDLRMAFTPNTIRRRQFVPNIRTVNVPYNRTVAIPGTRQVTYNVAKMVPYETTVKVARTITEYEDVEVTAYEPHTVTKTVAVGNRTQWAFVDPTGGSRATASAAEPTPARERSAQRQQQPQTSSNNGQLQQQSYTPPPQQTIQRRQPAVIPQHQPAAIQQPTPIQEPAQFNLNIEPQPAQPAPASAEPLFDGGWGEQGSVQPTASPSAQMAGWEGDTFVTAGWRDAGNRRSPALRCGRPLSRGNPCGKLPLRHHPAAPVSRRCPLSCADR